MKDLDLNFFLGKDEVELTDELIKKILEEKKWVGEKSLKEFAKGGATWNIKRQSLTMNMKTQENAKTFFKLFNT